MRYKSIIPDVKRNIDRFPEGFMFQLTEKEILLILKDISRISRKDSVLALEARKKINQIISCDSIEHYKNLSGPLKAYKRVHVGSYVILFRVKDSTIIFERFKHHDEVYEA